jgi:hypothetical protein
MRYVGLSLGHRDDAEAEHWLRENTPAGTTWACTHLAREPYPHVAISLVLAPGADAGALPAVPADLTAAADRAAADHRARRSGRAVLFPGVERLVGVLSAGDVLALSAIDEVRMLGGAPPGADTLVDTRGFVRPQWMDGTLVLVTTPVGGGRIAPFEVPHPTPCCADH